MLDLDQKTTEAKLDPPTTPTEMQPSAGEEAGEQPASSNTWAAKVIAAFDRTPGSPEAYALVDHLVAVMETHEGKRRRSRSEEQRKDLVDTIGRFAGDLAASIEEGGTRTLIACPKSANRFTDLPVGFRTFRAVHAAFLGLGLIELVTKGSWARIPEFGPSAGRGKTERIRASEAQDRADPGQRGLRRAASRAPDHRGGRRRALPQEDQAQAAGAAVGLIPALR
jgi:hypothetical protein